MSTDWRKLTRVLVILGGAYLAALSVVADLAQVLTLKYGVPLLALLLLAVLGYVGWEQGRGLWRNYRALQARLDEACDFLRRYGDNVWLCALTHWLFEQRVNSIRVSDADGQVPPEAKARRYLARVQEPARRLDEQARVRKKRDELEKPAGKIGALRGLLNQEDEAGDCPRTLQRIWGNTTTD